MGINRIAMLLLRRCSTSIKTSMTSWHLDSARNADRGIDFAYHDGAANMPCAVYIMPSVNIQTTSRPWIFLNPHYIPFWACRSLVELDGPVVRLVLGCCVGFAGVAFAPCRVASGSCLLSPSPRLGWVMALRPFSTQSCFVCVRAFR